MPSGGEPGASGQRPDRDAEISGEDGKRANVAPDAVKDPNEKTEGMPGVPPGSQDGEADPGGS